MLKRENLSDKLANIIGKKIIRNELRSGDIIVETKISREWGVSRSPVRDALHMLEKQRLVQKEPKGGYKVLELTTEYIESFYDTANMFYEYSFPRAVAHMTDDGSRRLLSIIEKIEKSVDQHDYDTYVDTVCLFAQTVLQIAKNPIIEQISLDVMPSAERILFAAVEISPSHLKDASHHIRKSCDHLINKEHRNAAKSFKNFANESRNLFMNQLDGENDL